MLPALLDSTMEKWQPLISSLKLSKAVAMFVYACRSRDNSHWVPMTKFSKNVEVSQI